MGNVFTCAESWLSFHPLKIFLLLLEHGKLRGLRVNLSFMRITHFS